MRLTILGALLSLVILPAAAQTADPVSGKWGSDGATMLDLKYDGRGGVTGTAIWRVTLRPWRASSRAKVRDASRCSTRTAGDTKFMA